MKAEEVREYWESNAETWTRHSRAGFDIFRDALNTPAFFEMLPEIVGLRGLDIGCGEGEHTRQLARAGAAMSAIDIAPTFIAHAQAAEHDNPLHIDFHIGNCAALPFPEHAFDFVTAVMCLMDMPDQVTVMAEVQRVLKPNGFLQFSILHPCFITPKRKVRSGPDGQACSIEVGDYFAEHQGTVDTWTFSTLPDEERVRTAPFKVPRFNHTLSGWVKLICEAGLTIEEFGEPHANEALAREMPKLAHTRIAPVFLHVRARKPK